MIRLLAVAASLLAVSFAWPQDQGDKKPAKDPQPGKLTISWHGQSFFSLKSSKGTVFVFDPHAITEYGRIEGIKPDVIFVSHQHNDHTQISIFENIRDKGENAPKIIQGLIPGEGGRETWNIIDETIKDLRVVSLGAYHDEYKGLRHGLTALFVVEVDGWRICHLGDLGHQLSNKQLKELGKLDVIMIPCGGIYSLNGAEAQRVVEQIKPTQYIFPMHIGNVRYDSLLPVDEFIDDNPHPCAIVRDGALSFSANARNNVSWLRENARNSDNTFVLEKHNQKRAVIVNLHYWPQPGKKKT